MEEFISFFQLLPFLYLPIWQYSLMAIVVVIFLYMQPASASTIKLSQRSVPVIATALTIIAIIFIGFRPYSVFFGDMTMYSHTYNNVIGEVTSVDLDVDTHSEWFWDFLMLTFKRLNAPDTLFFLFCAMLYIGCMHWACKRIMPNHMLLAMLFCFCSFSFWGYAVNGIRNGVGSSIALVALSYLLGNKREKVISALLFFLAFGIHRSIMLPTACAIVSAFVIKRPKSVIQIWIASIAVSLVLGNSVANIFAALGFDDRMNDYLRAGVEDEEIISQFSSTGFRWDFLIYSAMPIWMYWYVRIKRGIKNRTYDFLAGTYILANAFWVLVIRSSFSNRFAYLSWFMYPIVLAFPLLELKVWKRQHITLSLVLLLYEAFTFTMFLLGK